jgi:hypothetical protein
MRIPVRVESSNGLESGGLHPFTRNTPLRLGRIIKNQKILRSWARRNRVAPTARKLEVIVCFRRTYHDPIETIVITEAREHAKSQAVAVHLSGTRWVSDRSSDSKLLSHVSIVTSIRRGQCAHGVARPRWKVLQSHPTLELRDS